MEEIKKFWEQLCGKVPLPPKAEICRCVIVQGQNRLQEYRNTLLDIEEHRNKDEHNQVEALTKLCENISNLLEMFCQFRNLLKCIPHSFRSEEELSALIKEIESEYQYTRTTLLTVKTDMWTLFSFFKKASPSYYETYFTSLN